MKRYWIYIMLLLSSTIYASGVTTTTIMSKVMQAAFTNPGGNFLNYRVEGVCFWEHHNHWGIPYIKTTLKVEHFLPDAVVTVFTGDNPWDFANEWLDPGLKAAGDAFYKSKEGIKPENARFAGSGDNSMEKFKEVEVIGDPAVVVLGLFPMISSVATMFMPYYSSLADSYFWRTPWFDNLFHPEYLAPGIRTEGSLLDQWGSIYPRIGYINQLGDYKAASVIALRGADIATNGWGSHILVHPLTSGSCGWAHCKVWPSRENDFHDIKYQEIFPSASIHAKKSFGVNDLLSSETYGQEQYSKGNGRYVWVMWRHYKGCIHDSGKFLWETTW